MRGEMAHVWMLPNAIVDTWEKEDRMSDCPEWLLPQQPSVPMLGVEVGGDISFIAHECTLPESIFIIYVLNDTGIFSLISSIKELKFFNSFDLNKT